MQAKINVGINGFGRIGRQILRQNKDLNIVAINSPANIKMAAHLLKYDSVHGVYSGDVSASEDTLLFHQKKIHYMSYRKPKDIPWDRWNVDIVLECSGFFKKREDIDEHFKAGVKHVILAYPVAKASDITIIYGINHSEYKKEQQVISLGSCTTNALAPLVQVMHEHFDIEKLLFTTTHAYTLDQKLLDSTHKKDMRRARAAALSMIPTSTGASETLMHVFPALKGKVWGLAVRVPTPNVSLVDVVFQISKPANKKSIHQAFLSAEEGSLKDILHSEMQELVSIDFANSTYSSIVDMPSVAVIGDMVKLLAWYDNESGFAQRMLDFTQYATKKIIQS